MMTSGPPPFAVRDLWREGYEERMRWLRRGERRVLYHYHTPDVGTFRYRVFNPVEALRLGGEGVSASWIEDGEFDRNPAVLEGVEALVLARSRFQGEVERLIGAARARGIPVWMDLDDLVVDPDRVPELMISLNRAPVETEWNLMYATIVRHAEVLRRCDALIASTPLLAGHLRELSGLPVTVIPNGLNRLQQHVCDLCWRRKRDSGWARDAWTDLGYFSGTPTHDRDVALAVPALQRVMRRHPEIRLWTVGEVRLGEGWEGLKDRLQQLPFQDPLNLQRRIAGMNLNLVPLQSTDAARCKSDLKLFEAAAVGTWSLCSDTPPYQGAVAPGRNGWVCGAEDWEAQLEDSIRLLADQPCLEEAARQEMRTRHAWDAQTALLRSTLLSDGKVAVE